VDLKTPLIPKKTISPVAVIQSPNAMIGQQFNNFQLDNDSECFYLCEIYMDDKDRILHGKVLTDFMALLRSKSVFTHKKPKIPNFLSADVLPSDDIQIDQNLDHQLVTQSSDGTVQPYRLTPNDKDTKQQYYMWKLDSKGDREVDEKGREVKIPLKYYKCLKVLNYGWMDGIKDLSEFNKERFEEVNHQIIFRPKLRVVRQFNENIYLNHYSSYKETVQMPNNDYTIRKYKDKGIVYVDTDMSWSMLKAEFNLVFPNDPIQSSNKKKIHFEEKYLKTSCIITFIVNVIDFGVLWGKNDYGTMNNVSRTLFHVTSILRLIIVYWLSENQRVFMSTFNKEWTIRYKILFIILFIIIWTSNFIGWFDTRDNLLWIWGSIQSLCFTFDVYLKLYTYYLLIQYYRSYAQKIKFINLFLEENRSRYKIPEPTTENIIYYCSFDKQFEYCMAIVMILMLIKISGSILLVFTIDLDLCIRWKGAIFYIIDVACDCLLISIQLLRTFETLNTKITDIHCQKRIEKLLKSGDSSINKFKKVFSLIFIIAPGIVGYFGFKLIC